MSNTPTLAERLEQAGNSAAQSWIITELLLNAYPTTIRQSVIAAAVPHWFTAEILAALLDLSMEEAEERYVALQQLSIVQPFGDLGHTLHDLTRSGILAYLASNAPEELRNYSQRAQRSFTRRDTEQDPQILVESIYHQLLLNASEGRAALKTRARIYRNNGNFAAMENLLRNYRELIDLGFSEPLDQIELELQEYWTAKALVDRGKAEKDEQGTQYLRKAMEQFIPADQLPVLLASEPQKWRDEIDIYKRDYVLNQLEATRNTGDLARQSLWLTALGDIYRDQGDLEASLQSLTQALAMTPEDARTWAYRGQTYRLLYWYEEALADFDHAITLDEKYAWAIANRGDTYRLMKRYEKALSDFDRAIELDTKYTWAINRRGDAYREMERYEKALENYTQVISLNEKNTWAITLRGDIYRLMKRYEEALTDFNCAIALNDKSAWAIASRGQVYNSLCCYKEALADFDRAIELNEKLTWAITSRGRVYQSLKRYYDALTDFTTIIVLDEENTGAISRRGYIYLLLQNFAEAQVDINKALSIEENDWRFYCRGLSYLVQNQLTEAQSDLTRAIDLAKLNYVKEPHDWRNTLNLMLYHLVASDNSMAERFLQEAFDGNAPIPRLKAAIQDLEELLMVLPDHPQARIFLQRIEAYLGDLV
jgi:tetratricopeptide (TPR) repeat protein